MVFKSCFKVANIYPLNLHKYNEDIVQGEDGSIKGFYIKIKTIGIDDPGSNGPKLLGDLRKTINEFGIPNTYLFSSQFIEFDEYTALGKEIQTILTFSFLSVTAVILFITFNV